MFDHSKECTVPLAECRSSRTALAMGLSWSPFRFSLRISDKIFCSTLVSSIPSRGVQFAHSTSGTVMKQEVESS